MAVLVIGGAGYIGSVVVEHLLAAGEEVVVLDDLSRGHRDAVPAGTRLVTGSFGDRELISNTLREHRTEAVLHFAASSLVGESVTDPLRYYGNNVANGVELLRACVETGVRHFIFSSTAAIFGEPAEVPITEECPKAPTNPYGRTKLYFESLLQDCETAHGLKSVCLRYFNAAGATDLRGEHHEPETHLVPLVLEVAAGERESISVYGTDYETRDGTCIRDYIHVADLAEAHVLALQHLRTSNESDWFNLGNGNGFTVLEVLKAAEQVTGKSVARTLGPRRAGDPAVLVASSDKIRNRLGWKPRYPDLPEIIRSAWAWKMAHPNGYAR